MVEHHIKLKEGRKLAAQMLTLRGHPTRDPTFGGKKAFRSKFHVPVAKSEWVSPMKVAPKKNGKWHICVDYKPLNATKKE